MVQCLVRHHCALHGIPLINISQAQLPGLSSWGVTGAWASCAFMFGVRPSGSANPCQSIAKHHRRCCCMVLYKYLCVTLGSSIIPLSSMYCMPVKKHRHVTKSWQAEPNLLHAAFRAVSLKDWFGPGGDAMLAAGISLTNMQHVHSQTYQLQCNWKVFCDNYLVTALPMVFCTT